MFCMFHIRIKFFFNPIYCPLYLFLVMLIVVIQNLIDIASYSFHNGLRYTHSILLKTFYLFDKKPSTHILSSGIKCTTISPIIIKKMNNHMILAKEIQQFSIYTHFIHTINFFCIFNRYIYVFLIFSKTKRIIFSCQFSH